MNLERQRTRGSLPVFLLARLLLISPWNERFSGANDVREAKSRRETAAALCVARVGLHVRKRRKRTCRKRMRGMNTAAPARAGRVSGRTIRGGRL